MIACLAGVAVGWALLVATMTAVGRSSGDARYLIGWTVLVPVVAGTGVAHCWRTIRRLPLHRNVAAAAVGGLAVIVLIALLVPRMHGLARDLSATRNTDSTARALADAVQQAGGPTTILACGRPAIQTYFVPALAYRLHVHLDQVATTATAPGVSFAVASQSGLAPPLPNGVPFLQVRNWRVVHQCG